MLCNKIYFSFTKYFFVFWYWNIHNSWRILFCCFRISHKKSILYLYAQFLNCASISSKSVQSRINAYSSFVDNSAQKLVVWLLHTYSIVENGNEFIISSAFEKSPQFFPLFTNDLIDFHSTPPLYLCPYDSRKDFKEQ